LLSVRTVALGAAIAAPLLAGSLDQVLPPRQSGPAKPSRDEKVILGSAAAVCLVLAGLLAAVLPSVRGPANVPAGLDGALDALPAHTVIWNDYNLGGWIDYRHPTLEVVADGRAEAFGAAQLEKYGRVVRTEPGWEEILRASGAHVAIVGTDTPLAAALQERLGWRPLGEADGYVLLSDGTLR
jgi:hypothetical protein